ncbi:MAG: hypothetical protein EBZ50_01990 [Alphaproteobacteria bacterium]|nr:hypothetical protein [Alphaproteobacteria bacterium]
MKTIRKLLLVSFALLATAGAFAKPLAGPKGGKILTTEAPHAEFFVEKDRTVAVTFYDKDLKPLAPGERVVSAVAEAKTGKVKIEFEKTAAGFVSKQTLPEGDDYTVVVQIRDTAAAKPRNHRVLFHDELCAECKRAEYACVCDEAGGHGH